MRKTSLVGVSISVGLGLVVACSSGSGGNSAAPGGPDAAPDASAPDKPASTPSHGSMVGLSPDDSRLVVANRDVGTATVFAIDYTGTLPALMKLAEIKVGGEPSAVAVLPDGDTAFVLSRLDQKLTKITGLRSAPVKAGEVSVGSEPTAMAVTPLGRTVWVANWIDGTIIGVRSDTLAVSATIDLNATLAASPYVGGGATDRPSLAHPRAIAITNNGDAVEDDETIYATEFYAQQKQPLDGHAANADTSRVGLVYKIPLAATKTASIIELPPMADMGFQDHTGGTAGCFPNQLGAIQIQGGFGYVLSVCASPKGPTGIFAGPAAAACSATTQAAADSACPGGAAGSCGGLVVGKCAATTTTACTASTDCPAGETCTGFTAGTCKTNCTTNAACGAVGGQCVPTTGTDPSVGGTCAPNPADVRTTTATAVSVLDLAAGKTVATANLHKEFSAYFDSLGIADDTTRRFPLLPQDIDFVPGTGTAYIPAFAADALFRVDFGANDPAKPIDHVGDTKAPFMSLLTGSDAAKNVQLPSGIAVAHQARGAASTRYAYVVGDRNRNVAVVDLAAQEVAGLSAGTPTFATA
ncbi:MAG: hypothetical protein JOZ69_23370, partial [Myxococcales bacterium]|nr:hypothetical protein [Myxococcales bacterium]